MTRTGSLILTSPRTGSTWLASMINQTGQMGICDEWLEKAHFPSGFGSIDDSFYEQLLNLSSTPNGRFSVKVFPWHLYRISSEGGVDFIQQMSQRHNVKLVLLERKDKIAQAVSHAKARKSGMWTAKQQQKYDPAYSFERIFRSYLNIQNQDLFWKTYLNFKNIEYKHIFYEDILKDKNGILSDLAQQLNVSTHKVTASKIHKQSNSLNDEWTERFLTDIKNKDLLSIQSSRKLPSRSLKSIWKFLIKRPVSGWTSWHASDAFDHM